MKRFVCLILSLVAVLIIIDKANADIETIPGMGVQKAIDSIIETTVSMFFEISPAGVIT